MERRLERFIAYVAFFIVGAIYAVTEDVTVSIIKNHFLYQPIASPKVSCLGGFRVKCHPSFLIK